MGFVVQCRVEADIHELLVTGVDCARELYNCKESNGPVAKCTDLNDRQVGRIDVMPSAVGARSLQYLYCYIEECN